MREPGNVCKVRSDVLHVNEEELACQDPEPTAEILDYSPSDFFLRSRCNQEIRYHPDQDNESTTSNAPSSRVLYATKQLAFRGSDHSPANMAN